MAAGSAAATGRPPGMPMRHDPHAGGYDSAAEEIAHAVTHGVGCLLSLLGVLYPAIVAARMQPVEAMRVEQ
mgnify:CR=1 FL=1